MPAPATDLRWIRPPQQTRSQETLHRILDAAEALVAEKGVEDAAVAEIARRAGSSVGAFYARFQDKEGLVHALYDRFLEQAIATADVALDPQRWQGATIPEILEAVVRFLVDIYRAQTGLLRAFALRTYTHAEFQLRQERLSHYVSDRLCALLLERRREIRHPEPERAARFGQMLVFSALDHALLFGDLRSREFALSDADFSAELTRAYLAYLGV